MTDNIIERTIIVPAYSEAACIESTLSRLHTYCKEHGWLDNTELIVVTADAEDGTPHIVAAAIKKFPHHQHLQPGKRVGKGRDVRIGLQAARGRLAIFTDADLATPPHHLAPAFELLAQHGGMVIGIRRLSVMHKTLLRRMSSVFSNLLIRSVVGWDITDSQCGFKGFTADTARQITSVATVNNWGFDFEYIAIARRRGIPITTLPIHDWTDPKSAEQNLTGDSQLGAMWSTFKELRQVSRNVRKGLYDAQ